MLSINGEKSSDNLILMNRNKKNKFERRLYRYKSHKITKDNKVLDENEIDYIKTKKSLKRESRKKIKTLIKVRSSKSIHFGMQGISSNKNVNKFVEELVPDIIDNTYNFTLNYQLKETAINVLKSGIPDDDKTKIKFFSNYLYQLSPFNKIFSQLSSSTDINDINNLKKILYNLATELVYEYFDSNKIVFKHGDPPDKYYILLKGEVDIIVPNEIEVMMSEYEYFNYILRLYKYQEHSLLKKVLNKNYGVYPLNKKLLEDWVNTAYNTIRHLKKESQMTGIIKKRKPIARHIPNYENAEELVNRLEKEKKMNLLMMNKNVIILLEKIRIRNERARDAQKNRAHNPKKKEENKNNKKMKNKNMEESQPVKPSYGYSKLDGQLKKIFIKDEHVEIVEKCSKEIYQIMEILNEEFNIKNYIAQLNKCNSETYLNRVEPYFYDEETNQKLDSKDFILSKNKDEDKIIEDNFTESYKNNNDISFKIYNFFHQTKNNNKKEKKNELYNNRRKTIVYHYVLVNTLYSGEAFGEISNESIRKVENNQRIATIITRDNSHFASLKKLQYNKILKEINENILHQQLTFLFSLDLFKDCNRNNFMKNYISFFIKRTYRANEIVFNQDDDLGEDRSIYFIQNGTFSSFCHSSVNEIENLVNNLHYDGLIPEDDAHEDNLFNKENHYYNKFKKKKIIFNLFYFTKNDIVGFNDALYNGKYIYTVKCQSSTATIYEIKLKFFNLIVNSEAKLFQNVLRHEMIRRNLMVKFFLNAFNNKTNFYKFVSFEDEEDKEDKNIVHKNYFGKNPFREPNNPSNSYKKNKIEFKTINTYQNKISEVCLSLITNNNNINNIRIVSPKSKKSETLTTSKLLNAKNRNNSNTFENNKNMLMFRNKSKSNVKNSSSNLYNSKGNNIKTFREYSKNNPFFGSTDNTTARSKNSKILNKEKKFIIKDKNKDIINKDKVNDSNENNNDSFELKIEEYKSKSKNKVVIPPIITNQINKDILLNNKNKNLYNSLFDNKLNTDNINLSNSNNKVNLFINNKSYNSNFKNESSCPSINGLYNSSKKTTMKSEVKSINRFKKYLDTIDTNISLKNCDMTKQEEIQLKCYLKDIPEFFRKDNCAKKIFFGMNKKTMFQNNALFTEYK